jgi:ankyrin repeat protein
MPADMQIHCLAKHGDLAGVRTRLAQGAAVDVRDVAGWTALHHACASREAGLEMVAMLADSGADIDALIDDYQPPLHLAAGTGDGDKVRLLLARGCSLRPTPNGYTALIMAVYKARSLEVLELLLEAGVDPDTVSSHGESALGVSAARSPDFAATRLLLMAGADPSPLRWPPLMRSIALDDALVAIATIAGHPGSFAIQDQRHRSPMALALFRGSLPIIHALRERGLDLSGAMGRCGRTALMQVVIGDHVEALEWCLAQGVDADGVDDFGRTALMEAAQHSAARCVRSLLAAGADLHAASQTEDYAITCARSAETVGILIAAGADIDTIDGEGYGLLKYAAEIGDRDFTTALLAAGAMPDATRTGETALHKAVYQDDLVIMRELLQHGADPNAGDVDGWTPLFCAQSVEAVRLLRAHGAESAIQDLVGDRARDQIALRNEEAADEAV